MKPEPKSSSQKRRLVAQCPDGIELHDPDGNAYLDKAIEEPKSPSDLAALVEEPLTPRRG